MKKLAILSFLVAALASAEGFAKTEGNYVSASVLYNHINLSQDTTTPNSDKQKVDSAGFGIGYKHAISLNNNVFIAPGVFFENNNAKSDIENTGTTVNIKNRYGLRADLGYDLDDKTAAYLIGGLAFINYKVDNASGGNAGRSKSDFFYGVGLTRSYSKTTSVGVEYDRQDFELKAVDATNVDVTNHTIKLSLNYNF